MEEENSTIASSNMTSTEENLDQDLKESILRHPDEELYRGITIGIVSFGEYISYYYFWVGTMLGASR